ncbi:DNA repair protein rhp26 [Dimargaris cristalligena]|nr:DNA repair protein rhp26 [Dimargaris cristalligena]
MASSDTNSVDSLPARTPIEAGVSESLSGILGVQAIVDQDDLEASVMRQADRAMREKEIAHEQKRLTRAQKTHSQLEQHISTTLDKLDRCRTEGQRVTHENTLAKLQAKLHSNETDIRDIQGRLGAYTEVNDATDEQLIHQGSADLESERDRLIRTGQINPFSPDLGAPAPTITPQVEVNDSIVLPGSSDTSANDSESSSEGSGEEGTPNAVYKDDGDELFYQMRLHRWAQRRRRLRLKTLGQDADSLDLNPDPNIDEPRLPHPVYADLDISPRLRIPGDIHTRLFDYQKTCQRWLWELHIQKVGGIIGDEMGLGKTVQIASFLAALYYSGLLTRSRILPDGGTRETLPLPSLIVCPATIMRQWVKELRQWWPPLQVFILHSTGSARVNYDSHSKSAARKGKRPREASDGSELDDADGDEDKDHHTTAFEALEQWETRQKRRSRAKNTPGGRLGSGPNPNATPSSGKAPSWVDSLIQRVFNGGHIIVTTYEGVRIHRQALLGRRWGYVVLDEGHKIRNPDSEITLVCKCLHTIHRIILSGTPIQNNLTELWSLFDFVYPGRLGTLPVFQDQFAAPISVGGFANANNYQVQTAYKCACILRDLISPCLLRRLKVDVARDLPSKQEQVLFCNLTRPQRRVYETFLQSSELAGIMEGRRQVLFGIDIVRKICNHPDLLLLPRSSSSAASKKDSPPCSDEDRKGGLAMHPCSGASDSRGHNSQPKRRPIVSHRPIASARCPQRAQDQDNDTWDHGDLYRRPTQTNEPLSFVTQVQVRDHGTSSAAPESSSVRPTGESVNSQPPPAQLHALTDPDFGDYRQSGKMLVVKHLLELWEPQGHRVLIFTQTRQMLNLLEKMVAQIRLPPRATAVSHGDPADFHHGSPADCSRTIRYLRMDGTTPIQKRAGLLDSFNQTRGIFLFLLTTKVGGLGTNLTGADRVIIFDPDWNPSTDTQARERAWRLGQKRPVAIYRLMTAGTIEEKIYQRQIYKQFLTSKILKDPKQKRFFKSNDLRDLFTLGSDSAEGTETGSIFQGTEVIKEHDTGPSSRNGRTRASKERHAADDAIKASDQVAKIGPARATSGDLDQTSCAKSTSGTDDHVLEQLFQMNGLRTAVQHDSIIDADHQEEILVEREAARIAQEAAEALKKSRQEVRRDRDVSVPTWTGMSGRAGAPRRFGQMPFRPPNIPSPSVSFSPGSTPFPLPSFHNSPRTVSAVSLQPRSNLNEAAGWPLPKPSLLSAGPSSQPENPSLPAPLPRPGMPKAPGSGSLLAGLKMRQMSLDECPVQPHTGTSRVAVIGKHTVSHEIEHGARARVPVTSLASSSRGNPNRPSAAGFWRRSLGEPNQSEEPLPNHRSGEESTQREPNSPVPAATAIELDLSPIDFSRDSPSSILKKLRDYLFSVGGRVPSSNIVDHFRMKMKPHEVVTFRKMLKEIARFDPPSSTLAGGGPQLPRTKEVGTWVLKPEFR